MFKLESEILMIKLNQYFKSIFNKNVKSIFIPHKL